MSNPSPQVDPAVLKTTAREGWDRSAGGWDAHGGVIRTWLAGATEAMINMACIGPGHRVLDVAAGTGNQTLDLAERVGPTGSVLATDFSPEILALARRNVAAAGHRNVAFQVADGEALDVEPETFDAAVCRLGLMLFPDPLKGLSEMHRALRPGGIAVTLVFSTPQANPCLTALMQTAVRHAGLPPPDPYRPGSLMSVGRPGLIDALFRQAGFEAVATTAILAPFRLPSAAHYLAFVWTSASPIQQILGQLDNTRRAAAFAEMEETLRTFEEGGAWCGPNELLITAGHR